MLVRHRHAVVLSAGVALAMTVQAANAQVSSYYLYFSQYYTQNTEFAPDAPYAIEGGPINLISSAVCLIERSPDFPLPTRTSASRLIPSVDCVDLLVVDFVARHCPQYVRHHGGLIRSGRSTSPENWNDN